MSLTRAERMDRALWLAIATLEECLEHFEDRADADYQDDRFIPNAEMQMAQNVSRTIESIRSGIPKSVLEYIDAAQPVNPKVKT